MQPLGCGNSVSRATRPGLHTHEGPDIGAGARIVRGARIGDDETVAAGLTVATDQKGLWLAA